MCKCYFDTDYLSFCRIATLITFVAISGFAEHDVLCKANGSFVLPVSHAFILKARFLYTSRRFLCLRGGDASAVDLPFSDDLPEERRRYEGDSEGEDNFERSKRRRINSSPSAGDDAADSRHSPPTHLHTTGSLPRECVARPLPTSSSACPKQTPSTPHAADLTTIDRHHPSSNSTRKNLLPSLPPTQPRKHPHTPTYTRASTHPRACKHTRTHASARARTHARTYARTSPHTTRHARSCTQTHR